VVQLTSCNVLRNVQTDDRERCLLAEFFAARDFAVATKAAMRSDIEKFGRWFTSATNEAFATNRVTISDLTSFRQSLRQEQGQAVKTVNRCLVTLRRYFDWLVEQGHVAANPAKGVKQIGQQPSGPRGLDRPDVRKLLRHAELTGDVRGSAILHVFLFTGARVGEVAALTLDDLTLKVRGGSMTIRSGKGNKERVVPVPAPAREALRRYLAVRGERGHRHVFSGKCGSMTGRAIRMVIETYAKATGVRFSCHVLRHSFARNFLKQTNDLVALASLLGHANLQTSRGYCMPTQDDLSAQTELLTY
jgi:site-specific recombinase XerD